MIGMGGYAILQEYSEGGEQVGKPRKKIPYNPNNTKWFRSLVWLGIDHKMKLDAEILRRTAAGEVYDVHGHTTNLNRSAIIRDLIDQNLTLPDRLKLGQP